MKRFPFEPPTEYYDNRIEEIDEQICHLIRKRMDLSNNNPGFPPMQLISNWSKKYELYEDLLQSLFVNLLDHDSFKPIVEPKNFRKNIPILKSVEKDNLFYTITFLSQYENASIIQFHMYREDRGELTERPDVIQDYSILELSIKGGKTDYDCRMEGGSGSRGHTVYTYIISPALPDDLSNIEFVFKEYKTPYLTKPTGLEINIKMDS